MFRKKYFSSTPGRLLKAAAVSGILLGAALSAQAQWTGEKSYIFQQYDVKNYAVSALPGTDQYVMAGTVAGYNGNWYYSAIHCMFVDNTGNTTASRVFDIPAISDQVVGVHYLTQNDVAIVSPYPDVVVTSGNVTYSCGINVLRIDGAGILQPNTVNISSPNSFLWPMGSLQYDDRYLFICGYQTAFGIVASPGLTVDRQAFVLKYDMLNNSVVNMHVIESGTPAPYDLDMAMRMKKLSNGNVWVGGSVNGVNGLGTMMNRIIDPNTLNDVYAASFGRTTAGHYQSSFDIMEEQNGDLFVFGNTCLIDVTTGSVPDYFPRPINFHVTGFQSNLTPYTGGRNTWYYRKTDNTWGINTVPGRDDNSVIISGMEKDRICNSAYPNMLTGADNVNPFLTEMRVNMSGSNIVVYSYYWNSILSYDGTGPAAAANAYTNLFNPWPNMALGPITTVRDVAKTKDIVLTAPLWDPATSHLNMKWIRTDGNGELMNCPWAPACEYDNTLVQFNASGVQTNVAATVPAASGYPWNELDFRADYENDCSGQYKLSGIAAVEKQVNATVSPNPATSFVQVKLSAEATENKQLEVALTDVTGRQVTKLYSGRSNAMPAKLNLPQLASGLYHINIRYGDEQLKSQLITIK